MSNINEVEKEMEGIKIEPELKNNPFSDGPPKPQEKLKKSVGIALIGILTLLIFYAFYRATVPNNIDKVEKNEVNLKEEASNQSPKKDLDFDITSYTDYKVEKEKTYSSTDSINDLTPIPVEVKNERDEFLAQLIQQEIRDEMSARKSNLTFQNSNDNAQNQESMNQDNVLNEKKSISSDVKDNYNKYSEAAAISPYEIKAGSIIPGILMTGLNSDLPGTILGIVREDVYDSVTGNHLLIPKGTKLKGTYNSSISYGQSRILVVWERLIFNDGRTLNLDKFGGVDMRGYAGLTGKVNNHTYELFKAVVLSSMLGAGSSIIATNKANEDWESAAGTGAGETIMDIGGKVADKSLGIQPTIEIKQGSKFNIIVESDLILTPLENYYGRE